MSSAPVTSIHSTTRKNIIEINRHQIKIQQARLLALNTQIHIHSSCWSEHQSIQTGNNEKQSIIKQRAKCIASTGFLC